MKIILICGVVGAGKDTFANEMLIYEDNCKIMRLAKPLRTICCDIYKFDNSEEGYTEWKSQNRGKMVDMAQAMKKTMGKHIFAQGLINNLYDKKIDADIILVPDFRDPVEFTCFLDYFELKDIEVVFTNYKSDRYEIRDDPDEKMAQFLIKKGLKHREGILAEDFLFLMEEYYATQR